MNTDQPPLHVFGEKPLDLKKLSFDLDIKKFYPKEYLAHEYDIPVTYHFHLSKESLIEQGVDMEDMISINKEIKYDIEVDIQSPPIMYSYTQLNRSIRFKVASFGKYFFNEIEIHTTLDDKLKYINSTKEKATEKVARELLNELIMLYGKPNKKRGRLFYLPCDIYTWNLKDRIIKYCWSIESQTLSGNSFTLELYIVNKKYAGIVLERLPIKEKQ